MEEKSEEIEEIEEIVLDYYGKNVWKNANRELRYENVMKE